jgi:hypothetical protein
LGNRLQRLPSRNPDLRDAVVVNSFLDLADRQISSPRKARQRAAEKRAAHKAVADQDRSERAWRQWHDKDALLSGPYGDAARSLIAFLDYMTPDQVVETGPWRDADADARFEILALIDMHIVRLRERHGLPPFDDALPGARLNVFLMIREVLS